MDIRLPKRKKPGRTDFNTNAGAVRQWVEQLPLVNTGKSRERLELALIETNTLDIHPLDRYQLLELLSTPAMHVAQALKQEFLDKPVPPRDDQLEKAIQCLEMYNRMATGYRIMVADLSRKVGSRNHLSIAIHRAMRYLSEVLLTCFQMYIQYPEGLWKCIHSLYALAEKEGLSSRPIIDTTLPGKGSSTINSVYKQILLLSLACPYRLRQHEIHHVYNALLKWAGSSRLLRSDDEQAYGLFAINLEADEAPAYRALQDSDLLQGHWRILDTTEMAARIRTALAAQSGVETGTASGDRDTLQRLMLSWGVMPERRFSRHHASATVHLVVGLDAIHRFAGGVETSQETGARGKDEIIRDRQYLQDPTFDRPTRISTGLAAAPEEAAEEDDPLRGAWSAGTAATPAVEEWNVADMSAGGYCLLWDNREASTTRVGELVAIINPDEAADHWHLGVVRRMKFTSRRGLELGIQMLSPGASPVWARICKDKRVTSNRMKALLLPEVRSIHQQASLLLPSLPMRSNCISTLEYDDSSETIIFTQQLENTGCFAQFHYTHAE